MRYCFCELYKDEKLTQDNIDCIATWSDYDIECDREELAIEKFANWLDERNEKQTPNDTYHCAVVDEVRAVKYFVVSAAFTRDISWEVKP